MTELVSRFSIAGLRGLLSEHPQNAHDDAEQENIAANLESLMAQSTLQLEHLNHQPPNSDKADITELLTMHLKVLDKMMSKAS